MKSNMKTALCLPTSKVIPESDIFKKEILKNLCDHDRMFFIEAEKMLKTKVDATMRYGISTWDSLGSKGMFVDLNRKYWRLRDYLWNGNERMSSEKLSDTLYDLAVYCLLLVMLLRKEGKNV